MALQDSLRCVCRLDGEKARPVERLRDAVELLLVHGTQGVSGVIVLDYVRGPSPDGTRLMDYSL